jgi:glycerol-3-phosphate dehydrogenase subunit B
MSTAGIVVIGAGVAGTSAALAAARAGARVTLVNAGAGASVLWTGAIDGAGEPSDEARRIAESLGVVLGDSTVVTQTGLVRGAQGRDAAILDVLHLLPERTVGVVRCERPGWDADALVRTAGENMAVVDATILRYADEHRVPDADFAARHDEPARLAWLSERLLEGLQRAPGPVHALLLPPSLGLEKARAAELSERVRVTCGEVTALPGGPAGLRFEHARDRALRAAGVTVVAGRALFVEAVAGTPEAFCVHLAGQDLLAEAVVLAAGGLLGGGVAYEPSEAMLAAALPPMARVAFRCTVEAPVRMGAHGRALDIPGSLFGVAPELLAWPLSHDALMDRVGVLCGDAGRIAPRLYAAGEIVADGPRTWLPALESGVRAGLAAASDTVKAPVVRPSSRAAGPATRP